LFLFCRKVTPEERFSHHSLPIFRATYDAWLAVVINNNEKYEQYITPVFCAFAQTSTLACNNVRPVVYPPSDGEHEAQGIAGNLA
jgi:hypothetical protein